MTTVSLTLALLTGCAGDSTPSSSTTSSDTARSEGAREERFPDIVSVDVTRGGEMSASFAVTVSSPYDSPQRYADGWRVLDQDGAVLGEHTLGHDHANEQPFTRTQSDVEIPEGTTELTIEGRDQISGYGGETVTVSW